MGGVSGVQTERMEMTQEIENLTNQDYSVENDEYRIAQAQKQGLAVFSNDEHTLTFDLDTEEAVATFKYRVLFLEKKGLCESYTIAKSKNGNWHAVVTTHTSLPVSEPLRIALQACMGSDWKREVIGCLRVLNYGDKTVSMLFRPLKLEVVETHIRASEDFNL